MEKQKDCEWWWLLAPGQQVSGLSIPKYHQGMPAIARVLNSEEIANSLLFQLSQNMTVQSREPGSGHIALVMSLDLRRFLHSAPLLLLKVFQ